MHILLTGATGYIGRRLLPVLVEAGHDVTLLVRNRQRLALPGDLEERVRILEGDLLKPDSLPRLLGPFDAAYYLVHSMTHGPAELADQRLMEMECQAAQNFVEWIEPAQCSQIVYLSGIAAEPKLSAHLQSRLEVERLFLTSRIPTTVLRAGIVIGSGSASFEIIRDLVEKLPFMVAPKWINQLTQPIAIYDVLHYLQAVLGREDCMNRSFDVGGPDVLTYRDLLLQFAKVRGLRRLILPCPRPHAAPFVTLARSSDFNQLHTGTLPSREPAAPRDG